MAFVLSTEPLVGFIEATCHIMARLWEEYMIRASTELRHSIPQAQVTIS